MHDFFFISSPLHFFIAANIALQCPSHQRTAIIIGKNREFCDHYAAAASDFADIFDEVIALPGSAGRFGSFKGKGRLRKLRDIFSRPMAVRIFTGNDRRIEFQYAMHMATRVNGPVEGIYMDEGIVTYIGHKSMNRFQHRFVDPVLRKLFYGPWWKNASTTGTSAWITSAYVAFPAAVHPLLRRKELVAIDTAPFRTERFKALAARLLVSKAQWLTELDDVKVVITLPHEDFYLQQTDIYRNIAIQLKKYSDPTAIAVKAHPRIRNHAVLAEMFPGCILLDNTIGMEILLPLLGNHCVVLGDISSTLLTARWLRPDLPVIALDIYANAPTELIRLYQALDIPLVAEEQLHKALTEIDSALAQRQAGRCSATSPGTTSPDP